MRSSYVSTSVFNVLSLSILQLNYASREGGDEKNSLFTGTRGEGFLQSILVLNTKHSGGTLPLIREMRDTVDWMCPRNIGPQLSHWKCVREKYFPQQKRYQQRINVGEMNEWKCIHRSGRILDLQNDSFWK